MSSTTSAHTADAAAQVGRLLTALLDGKITSEMYLASVNAIQRSQPTNAAVVPVPLPLTLPSLPTSTTRVSDPQLDSEMAVTAEHSERFRVTLVHRCLKKTESITFVSPLLSVPVFVPVSGTIATLHEEAIKAFKSMLSYPAHAVHKSYLLSATTANTTLFWEDKAITQLPPNRRGGRHKREWNIVSSAAPNMPSPSIVGFAEQTEQLALCLESWLPVMAVKVRARRNSKRPRTDSDGSDNAKDNANINTNSTNNTNNSDASTIINGQKHGSLDDAQASNGHNVIDVDIVNNTTELPPHTRSKAKTNNNAKSSPSPSKQPRVTRLTSNNRDSAYR